MKNEKRLKNIKNDAGEARDPFKKMRLENEFIVLGELCMYDLCGASCGQKRRTNYVFHVQNKQNKRRKQKGARGTPARNISNRALPRDLKF